MTLAFFAVVAGSLAQATSGLGFTLVCGPLLFAALGAEEGLRTVVVLAAILNTAILVREHRAIRYADAAFILIPAVLATLLFARALGELDESASAVAAGVLTVAASTALLAGLRIRALHGRSGAAAAGVVSGVMNTIAGIGGPPVALYAVNADWPAAAARATLQAIFLTLNIALLSQRGMPALSPWLLLAMVIGYALGVVVMRWLSEVVAKRATLLIAIGGGVALVVGAL